MKWSHIGSDLRNLKLDGSRVVAVQQNTDRAIRDGYDVLLDTLTFSLEDGRKIRYDRIFHEIGDVRPN